MAKERFAATGILEDVGCFNLNSKSKGGSISAPPNAWQQRRQQMKATGRRESRKQQHWTDRQQPSIEVVQLVEEPMDATVPAGVAPVKKRYRMDPLRPELWPKR